LGAPGWGGGLRGATPHSVSGSLDTEVCKCEGAGFTVMASAPFRLENVIHGVPRLPPSATIRVAGLSAMRLRGCCLRGSPTVSHPAPPALPSVGRKRSVAHLSRAAPGSARRRVHIPYGERGAGASARGAAANAGQLSGRGADPASGARVHCRLGMGKRRLGPLRNHPRSKKKNHRTGAQTR